MRSVPPPPKSPSASGPALAGQGVERPGPAAGGASSVAGVGELSGRLPPAAAAHQDPPSPPLVGESASWVWATSGGAYVLCPRLEEPVSYTHLTLPTICSV
eukprot:7137826-Alexandrium_andersonii.AAC.1